MARLWKFQNLNRIEAGILKFVILIRNHEREARVIYLLTNDRQTMNYYSAMHELELIYFDSNTQKR